MLFGKRITRITTDGKPVFENSIDSGKLVGEITLKKANGKCNICLNIGKLTKDHVPPQCMGNTGKVHYLNYHNYSSAKSVEYFGIAQNGIQYETICPKCNNERLKKFDDEIVKLVNQTNVALENGATPGFTVTVRPNSIIRGVLGHLLAGQLIENGSVMDPMFRDAVLKPDDSINNTLGFYVVPHFSPEIRVLKNVMLAGSGKPLLMSAFKIQPFSFIVTDRRAFPTIPSWHSYFDIGRTDEAEVCMFKLGSPPFGWPEESQHVMGKVYGQTGAESIIGFREV